MTADYPDNCHVRSEVSFQPILSAGIARRHGVPVVVINRAPTYFACHYAQDAGEPRSIMSATGFPALQLHKQHFSGPGCWGKAFEIPEIDFYFAPTDYMNTGLGGDCLILNMPASLRLHGKVCWMEDDQRTHLYDVPIFLLTNVSSCLTRIAGPGGNRTGCPKCSGMATCFCGYTAPATSAGVT